MSAVRERERQDADDAREHAVGPQRAAAQRANTSRPTPASAKRMPAPSSGGVSSRPILIATHVLDQMSDEQGVERPDDGAAHRPRHASRRGRRARRPGRRTSDTPERMSDLDRAVQTVVRRCLDVKPDEDVVVVVDEPLQDLGEKLRAAAQADRRRRRPDRDVPARRPTAPSRPRRSPRRWPRAMCSSRPRRAR